MAEIEMKLYFKINKYFKLGGIMIMKIGISVKGKNKDSLLDKRFGRCEYFQIHDTDTGEIKVLENEAKLASSGAGIAA